MDKKRQHGLPTFGILPSYRIKRVKRLILDGHEITAKVRKTLHRRSGEIKEVLVISGPQFRGRLPESERILLQNFSEKLARLRDKELASDTAAWKAGVDLLSGKRSILKVFDIAWDHGPVPVIQVGTCLETPVCMTAVLPPKQQGQLFNNTEANSIIILQKFKTHLQPCLHEYMSDVADMLFSVQLQPKSEASRACRKADETLETSMAEKFNFLNRAAATSGEASKLAHEILQEQRHEIRMFKAAYSTAKAAIACTRYCLGEISNPQDAIDLAVQDVSSLPEYCPEKSGLLRCAELLESSPAHDELSPIANQSNTPNTWLSELITACRFISELKTIIFEHGGSERVSIFVSHHMGTYASTEFYRDLKARVEDRFNKMVVVTTGTGRRKHIQTTILAKIWLSDVQLLYLPNSLDRKEGKPEKRLGTYSDWVIEEIFYGGLLEKDFHIVRAINDEDIKEKFMDQLQQYKWESLVSAFRLFTENLGKGGLTRHGCDLALKVEDHIRRVIYSLHHPGDKGLSEDDEGRILRSCIIPALKKRFKELIHGLRLSMHRNHWLVVQGIIKASQVRFQEMQDRFVSAREIADALKSFSRPDRRPITEKWILDVLLQIHDSKLSLGPKEFPLVEQGPWRDKHKTVRLGLNDFPKEFRLLYKDQVRIEEIEAIMRDELVRPVGENHVIAKNFSLVQGAGH
jgi:hypothetical protein